MVIVEDYEFEKKMIRNVYHPSFQHFSQQTWWCDIIKYYKDEKQKSISYFKPEVSNLINLTYLDFYTKNSLLIYSFAAFDDIHTDQNITELFFADSAVFEISKKEITLSLYNASNSNLSVEYIRSSLLLSCHGVGDFYVFIFMFDVFVTF